MRASLNFIGIIHSSLRQLEDCPLQENESAPECELEISSAFIEAASDFKVGDQLLLLLKRMA